jgi:hypothetical protein
VKKTEREPFGAPLPTPHAVEGQGTAKNATYARFFWRVFRGTLVIVALCASARLLAALLFEAYGGRWEIAAIVHVLASFTLFATLPKRQAQPPIEGEGAARHGRLPPWSLIIYLAFLGLELNWACAFFWFSRRYAFFSVPVVGVTGLIIASYAGIALLVARLSGNWRIALAIFGSALLVPPVIVLRLGLLW